MRICAIDHVQLAMPPGGEAWAQPLLQRASLGLDEVPKPADWPGAGGVVSATAS